MAASPAVSRLARTAQSASSALARYRMKARVQESRIYALGGAAAGAAIAGAIDGKMGKPEILGVPAVPAVAALMAVAGLSEWVPAGEHVAAIGTGALCGSIYSYTAARLTE